MNKLSETRYEKVVRIKSGDRYAFYNEKTSKVEMFLAHPFNNSVEIRILFTTIDDPGMVFDYTCPLLEGESVDNNAYIAYHFERIKTFIYDKIPKTVSLKWMYEHGFCPF